MIERIKKNWKELLTSALICGVGLFVLCWVEVNEPKKQTKIEKISVETIENPYIRRSYMTEYMKKVQYKMYPELSNLIYISVMRSSKEFNLDPVILYSIIIKESTFRPFARSKKNCLGLTQVNPEIWLSELKVIGIVKNKYDLYNPIKNIRSGAYIFSKMIKMSKGDVKKALRRYFGLLRSGRRSGYDTKVLKIRTKYIEYVLDREDME